MNIHPCSACKKNIQVDPADLGHEIECPFCAAAVTIYPPSKAVLDDDDDDFDDRPRRRRRRQSRLPETDEEGYELLVKAFAILRGPANRLFWAGLAGMLFSILVGIGYALLGKWIENQPKQGGLKNDEDPIIFLIIGVVFMVFGAGYFLALAIAAYKMKSAKSSGCGYTASILGIVTIVLFGPCLPMTWIAFPLGIMGIIALSKREVQDAFRWLKERKRRRDFDEDE